jgi:hypothetical protein
MALPTSTIVEIINNCTKQIIDLQSFCDIMNTDTAGYFHEYFTKFTQDDDYVFESTMIPAVPKTDTWDNDILFKYSPPYSVIQYLNAYFSKFDGGQDTYFQDNGLTVPVQYADGVFKAEEFKLASFNVEAPDLYEFGSVEVASGGALVYTASGAFQTDDWSRPYGENINPVVYTGYAPTTRVEIYNDSYNAITFDITFNCVDEFGNVFQHQLTDTVQPDEAVDFGSATKVSGVFGIDASSQVYYASTGDKLVVRVKTLVL